jgi:hypothetical protein
MRCMSTERRTDSWWEPTWTRLVGSTLVLFLVILAFLVGRVRAGADPGLARETTGAATQQQQVAPQGGNGSGTDPFAAPQTDPGIDPGASGSTDNFGNAVPDRGGGQSAQDDGRAQGFDGPSTHVS